MKSLLTVLLIAISFLPARAQHQHFIYLQTDNKQPFFVRVNEQVYSSSTSGYVVIPKLIKGDYTLSVGFPKNEFPQQLLAVRVNGDGGYLLKNFPEKGWGLYNIQTMEVIMAGASKVNAPTAAQTRTDAFSNVLADVVNTPSLKEEQVKAKEPEVKPVAAEAKQVVKEQPVITETVQAPVTSPVVSITRISLKADAQGSYAIYYDPSTGDTIRVFIERPAVEELKPSPEPVVIKADTTVAPKAPEKNEVAEIKAEQPKTQAAEDKRFLDIEISNPNSSKDSTGKISDTRTPDLKNDSKTADTKKGLSINSDCKSLANDNDFLKARKKMAAEDNNDDMVSAARKLFKAKCYSTEQIRNLAVLFLTDEGKYKFFDAAYPFVHDTQNFSQLQTELREDYYISRFRAMVRQ